MTATKPTQEYTNELVTIGRIRRPTGISGAVLADVYSGNADRFHVGDVVTVGERTLTIIDTGRSGNSAKLTFKSIDSIEKADQLRNHEISVFSDELPINPSGIYYHYEIMDTKVETVEGQRLGKLTEIIETGSNDVLVITSDAPKDKKRPNEILIPVIEGVIVELDRINSRLIIDPPDGII